MKTNRKKHRLIFGIMIAFCLIIATPVIPAIFLDDLEDVIITSPSNGEFLIYNSTLTNWTNVVHTGNGNGNPFDQNLNTTDDVQFKSVATRENITIRANYPARLFLGSGREGQIYVEEPVMFAGRLVIDAQSATMGMSIRVSGADNMRIDTAGIITTPQQSACRVRLASTQAVPSDVWTKLLLTVEDYDQNNDYDNGLPTRFNVPVSGLYHICYSVKVSGLHDNDYLESIIYKNGVPSGGHTEGHIATDLVIGNIALSGSDILRLSTNDYIEIYVQHNFGSARNFYALIYTNYMAICKIA